ncbi:MAG: flagellar type III secretion system pore protein FliP [Gemmatimonadota bacterium]
MMGFLAAFGVVFLLLGLSLQALKRYMARGSGRGGLRMEVVQRIALGPKQGIAVVRIGERLVAVSLGDGGVRPVLELGEAELEALAVEKETPIDGAGPPATSFRALLDATTDVPGGRQIRAVLRAATRTAALVLLGLAFAAAFDPAIALAQNADAVAQADTMLTRLAPQIDVQVGDGGEGLRLSGTVGVVVMMGLLTLLPTLILMMTSFTRIFIVLHFLRQAIGTQSAPPAHLMAGLALLLTGFVMAPTFGEVNRTALQPWMDGQMEQGEMLSTASGPMRQFMLGQTRDRDLGVFLDMSRTPDVQSADDVPLVVLMSAFVTSELRTAFQIGFALFLPFIVIDVVVASVLMSMGMFMLPPPMIALPFKILLFVLVDGWTLIVQGLVSSFN